MSAPLSHSTKLAVSLRIAIVQLNPQIGQVGQNVARATKLITQFKEALLSSKAPRTPDLVVFPEFALTGYNFHSRDHILPYTSKAKEGPSFELAQRVSEMFGCYTVIGYPERSETLDDSNLYNSAIVVGPDGDLVFNYRKSFLYYTDEDWGCQENPMGFQSFPLVFKDRATSTVDGKSSVTDVTLKTSIGICMDLSPYKFEAPFQDFEFATYNIDKNNELIICPMAWLHSCSITQDSKLEAAQKLEKLRACLEAQSLPTHGSQGDFQLDLDNSNHTERLSSSSDTLNAEYLDMLKPDMSNVNFWIMRFSPFLALQQRHAWSITDLIPFLTNPKIRSSYIGSTLSERWKFKNKNAIVAMANRCGIEDGSTVFAGSSGIYKYNGKYDQKEASLGSENKSVELLGNLGKGAEGVIMRDVDFEVCR